MFALEEKRDKIIEECYLFFLKNQYIISPDGILYQFDYEHKLHIKDKSIIEIEYLSRWKDQGRNLFHLKDGEWLIVSVLDQELRYIYTKLKSGWQKQFERKIVKIVHDPYVPFWVLDEIDSNF